MEKIYAIGDIHGQHDMMLDALTRIEADGGAAAKVIFLGALGDRGPDSRAVIDTLSAGRAQGRDWTALRGNHDRMFLNFLEEGALVDPRIRSREVRESGRGWLHPVMGGGDTLASYGIDTALPAPALMEATRTAVPPAHYDFLRACPLYHIEGDLLFVHAGIDPALPLDWQDEDRLIWIRDPFLEHSEPFEWLVVHGHSAIEVPRHYGNRVNLDSGAGFGRPLTAAVFDEGQVFVLGPRGRIPLEP